MFFTGETMFNELNPTKSEQNLINEGMDAYKRGLSITQNPHDNENAADWWAVGWFAGKARLSKKKVFG
jgi:hypothetical protein